MVVSPYTHPGSWYKGSLHSHSTNSDGGLTPAEVAEYYRERGYDFFAQTDHGVLTPTAEFSRPDFLCLPGEELSNPHMVALGIRETIRDSLDFASQIAAIRAQGAMSVLAHPAWMGLWVEEIAAQDGLWGMEVYNFVCETLNGKGLSLNIWDELLHRGKRLWGVAVDDAHHSAAHPGGDAGWVMARAPGLTAEAILASLADGCFYSSTGPAIDDIELLTEGDEVSLRVRCSPCRAIVFIGAAYYGKRYLAPEGEALTEATQRLRPEMKYCRVECRAADGTVAWTNPVFVG